MIRNAGNQEQKADELLCVGFRDNLLTRFHSCLLAFFATNPSTSVSLRIGRKGLGPLCQYT